MPQRKLFTQIITRKQAKSIGIKYYFNGIACKHGHFSVKQTSNGTCRECILSNASSKAVSPRRDSLYNINDVYGFISRASAREKSLTRYFTGKKCPNGHISERMTSTGACVDCLRKHTKKWLSELPEDKKAKRRKRHLVISKAYCDNNPVSRAKSSATYHKNNPMNAFLRKSIKRIEHATGRDRINKAEVELGYTKMQFVEHVESLWLDGMSWDNRSEWHIDHIKPLSLFIKEGVTDVKTINALSNLQPLWAKDNLSKGAKYGA